MQQLLALVTLSCHDRWEDFVRVRQFRCVLSDSGGCHTFFINSSDVRHVLCGGLNRVFKEQVLSCKSAAKPNVTGKVPRGERGGYRRAKWWLPHCRKKTKVPLPFCSLRTPFLFFNLLIWSLNKKIVWQDTKMPCPASRWCALSLCLLSRGLP